MTEFVANLMMSDLFIPHGHCYLWNTRLVGLHLLSDLTIAVAYYSIPLTLFYFVKQREDLPFNWIFTLFGAFIIFCGTTHLLEVWTLWHPVYWLSGTVKAMTAIVSAYTAIVLVRLIPQALKLPSPAQLEVANGKLQQQIRDRELAEAQIQQLNEELEARVAERTQELADSVLQASDLAERLSLAIESAGLGICDWNIIAKKIIWNRYHEILLDYQPRTLAEYTYEDWERRVHPDDLDRVTATIDLAMATHTDYSSEYRVIWENGSIHWLDGFGRFYYNSVGVPIRMTGLAMDITTRKQAELALAVSEERMSLTIEAAQIGTFDWNVRTGEIIWNDYHRLFLGYPLDTPASYVAWESRVHPEDLQRVRTAVQLARDTRTDYAYEYRIIWADGSLHWLEAFGRFYYDSDRRPLRMTGIVNDITDRKLDETNLRRSEEFNRRILENNKDCMKVIDLEGRLLYMNDGGKKLMEIGDFAAVYGNSWIGFWKGVDRESARMAFEAAKAGAVSKFEGLCPTALGKPKHWQVTVAPMFDERGNVEQILSISHDITERIAIESAIRESEERFRSTFEQAAVGVAHVSLEGQWLLVNQQLCQIVGYPESELLQIDFQTLTSPEDLPQDLAAIQQLLDGKIQTIELEKRYIHKLGHRVWVDVTASLRRDTAGEPIYFIVTIADITARKESELALQAQAIELAQTTELVAQRNQELDRFTHIVSHDLKAPLRGIANLAEWIADDLEGEVDPDIQTNLELMRSRVYRMETMINGLLQYARVGNTEQSVTTFAIADLLAEILDSLSLPPSFAVELPAAPSPITTNRLLLSQVLTNTIGNACKHHDRSDGRIQVTAQILGDRLWEFTISDDGPGIPPRDRDRVFGMFQTLSSEKQDSTGIGLSIVKKIVESQGGHIAIVAPYLGGTTFRFTWREGESFS
jgi:PAS domain S-box-containing protein